MAKARALAPDPTDEADVQRRYQHLYKADQARAALAASKARRAAEAAPDAA